MESSTGKKWDFFICHASEDKEDIAKPLAEELRNQGMDVWYDDFTLECGDNLRREINKGLSNSKYAIVILSPSFFEKEWAQKELDGLTQREVTGKNVILPIWHNVTSDDIRNYSPFLADKVALSTSKHNIKTMAENLINSAFSESESIKREKIIRSREGDDNSNLKQDITSGSNGIKNKIKPEKQETKEDENDSPSAFISYAWEGEEHKEWVMKLACDLREDHVDVMIDEWDLSDYGGDLDHFIERGIKESDYVIMVCTPTYAEKANQRKGGVGRENTIITTDYYDKDKKSKFMPIAKKYQDEIRECLPDYMKSKYAIDFSKELKYDDKFETLLRKIFQIPEYKKPELGDRPQLGSKDLSKVNIENEEKNIGKSEEISINDIIKMEKRGIKNLPKNGEKVEKTVKNIYEKLKFVDSSEEAEKYENLYEYLKYIIRNSADEKIQDKIINYFASVIQSASIPSQELTSLGKYITKTERFRERAQEESKLVDNLIMYFSRSGSYITAQRRMRLILNVTDLMTPKQINSLSEAISNNDQIYDAIECRKELPSFLRNNQDVISREIYNSLKEIEFIT